MKRSDKDPFETSMMSGLRFVRETNNKTCLTIAYIATVFIGLIGAVSTYCAIAQYDSLISIILLAVYDIFFIALAIDIFFRRIKK